ncbi:hypothetical protein D9M68_716470 [compost metagenome]
MLVIAEDFFRVFEETQFPFGEHPVWNPAGHHDGFLRLLGASQGGGHGWAGTRHQLDFAQVVFLDRFFGAAHHAGAGIDTGNFAVEVLAVGVEVFDGLGFDVVRHDQADFRAIVVGAEYHDLVFELLEVFAMSSRQPGGEGGVEVAAGHALPHDGGFDRLQRDAVAEVAFEDFTGDVGNGDAVVPAVDVADFQGRFVRRHGGGHAQRQGGDAEALEAEGLQVAHRSIAPSVSGSSGCITGSF